MRPSSPASSTQPPPWHPCPLAAHCTLAMAWPRPRCGCWSHEPAMGSALDQPRYPLVVPVLLPGPACLLHPLCIISSFPIDRIQYTVYMFTQIYIQDEAHCIHVYRDIHTRCSTLYTCLHRYTHKIRYAVYMFTQINIEGVV